MPKTFPLSFVISAQKTVFEAVGQGLSLDQWLEALASTGYDGVELAVRRPKEIPIEPLKQALSRYRLEPVALGTGQAFNDEGLSLTASDEGVRAAALQRLFEHIELAHELGVACVIIGLIRGQSSKSMDRELCLDHLCRALLTLAPRAAEAGVRLALEPINRYETDLLCTLDQAAKLLDRVDHPALGLLPDTFHMNIEETDPIEAMERHKGRIAHFHVADSNRHAPGHGHLDLRSIFEALTRTGYSGFVSVECLPRPDRAHEKAMESLSRLGLGRRASAALAAHVQESSSRPARSALRIHPKDNVAVALVDLHSGQTVQAGPGSVILIEDVPFGHKLALEQITRNKEVIRYGSPIGQSLSDIPKGAHVHTKNVKPSDLLAERVAWQGEPQWPVSPDPVPTFHGYVRFDGNVGTRNELWILPTVGCLNGLARTVAQRARPIVMRAGMDGVKLLSHPFGCSQTGEDMEALTRILSTLAFHPNAGGVLVLGLGCENNDPELFYERLSHLPVPRKALVVAQKSMDPVGDAMASVRELIETARKDRRQEVGLDRLCLGVKCGGSDGLSGITANALLGRLSNMVGGARGRVVMGEIPEVFGAEHVLARRAVSFEKLSCFYEVVEAFRSDMAHYGAVEANPSPGNIEGGITTLAEKSLGCVQKAGSVPLTDVIDYGGRATAPGLSLLSCPGNDLVSGTSLTAAGCTIVAFTTGRGTPLGLLSPTVKIGSRSDLAREHPDWIDFDAGRILLEEETMEEMASELCELVCRVASGSPTMAEQRDDSQAAFWKRGVTL